MRNSDESKCVNMSQTSLLPEDADFATQSSFVETAHKHRGDYIVFSSESLNVHRQTAMILHVHDHIVRVEMAEIPQDAVPTANTGQHTALAFSLDMRCAGNRMRYADITANAVVSIATQRPAQEELFGQEYDRACDGSVRQVEVTRMTLGENQDIVFTPGSGTMQVLWTAHNFIEHHIARERVILRYNCSYATDDNKMLWPIQGDMLQIFFPHVKPVDNKSFFNHLYVTCMCNEPIHGAGDALFWSVQHDGIGFPAEMRLLQKVPGGTGPVNIRIPGKYLRYSKLMPGDTVFYKDDTTTLGIVQHVIREHALRGQSEYAVKYPCQDRFVVQERHHLACRHPKSSLSAVHGRGGGAEGQRGGGAEVTP